MSQILVDIALPVPLDRIFTYLVPPDLHSAIEPGKRVLVPFGNKHLTGVIVNLPPSTTIRGLKPITDVLDTKPTFLPEMLALTKWIAEYYLAPWGEVLKSATPQGLSQESKKIVRLNRTDLENLLQKTKKSAPRQYAILKALEQCPQLSVSQLERRVRYRSLNSVLNEMNQRGWISVEEKIQDPKAKPKYARFLSLGEHMQSGQSYESIVESVSSKQRLVLEALKKELSLPNDGIELNAFLQHHPVSLSSIKTLVRGGLVQLVKREMIRSSEYEPVESPPHIQLNAHQQKALNEINTAALSGNFRSFLLHGVTGSGKTQVYIEAIRHILTLGKTSIVLVPEISLTPQTVRRFKAHFGSQVVVMHSQMSVGERYDSWRLAHQGTVKIVIGPRSAIFAPLQNVGLIVVDEEHDASYKQHDATPRYNARDVALVRASQSKAVVVLGSATPSMESYTNALQKKYSLLELPERVDIAKLPMVEIVDMTKERIRIFEQIKSDIKKNPKPFPKRLPDSSVSKLLQEQIARRLERKEGVILLQNRRGFSHVVECYNCGFVEKCEHCDVTLTFHSHKKQLRCHYCGSVKKPPQSCPVCTSSDLRMYAFGTQQVQQELQELFPQASIVRMDRDSTAIKGAHNKILKQFENHSADILLGTQMVAKGLDFPHVTLVGVISADTQVLLPDFRASEVTFQLLTQVAGRAGRSNLAGEVIIQTLQPDHYSLKHVVLHNFLGFYNEELEYRRELQYPPFSRIVLIEFSGAHENEVRHHAKEFVHMLASFNQQNRFIVLGPADAAIPKIKNIYRNHVLIKDSKIHDPSGSYLRSALSKAKTQYETVLPTKSSKVKLTIDVDPMGMM